MPDPVGGNAFHGSAFYYNRNSATGANEPRQRRQSETRRCFAAIRRWLGGPIVRNRLCSSRIMSSNCATIRFLLLTQLWHESVEPGRLRACQFFPTSVTTAPNCHAVVIDLSNNLPQPGTDLAPDPNNATYLQQVSCAIYSLNSIWANNQESATIG